MFKRSRLDKYGHSQKSCWTKGFWSMEMVWRLPWAVSPFGLVVVITAIAQILGGVDITV